MTQLRIAILQTPAPDFGEQHAAWRAWLQRIDDAARDEPDLIVLPEASFPAWFLAAAAETPPAIADWELIRDLAERARRHRVHIAAGLVLGRPSAPVNAAILLDPQGVELARATESQPASWFRPGSGAARATVASVACLLVAGTDLQQRNALKRDPLSSHGGTLPQLIISTGAPRGSTHGHPEVAHAVLATRAIESRAWVASAGRVGVEAEAVSYLGGAGIASPDGRWVTQAPADRPGIVLHTVEFGPVLTSVADPASIASAPLGAITRSQHGAVLAASLALDPSPSAVDLIESVRASVRAAGALGAQVVVLPDLTGNDPRAVTQSEVLPLIEAVAAETATIVIATLAERAGGALFRTISLVEHGRLLASRRQSVISEADRQAGFSTGAEPVRVAETSAGRIGLLAGAEALVPALPASLREHGAQLLAWSTGGNAIAIDAVARTRAWEHHLPVVTASSASGGAYIVDPAGHLLAANLPGQPMLVSASIDLT